ncbi:MAG TPA: cell division protein ZapA [Myxococcota bacterium]|nr:cell division protein ZapA [Myxococcota bacterium]
MTEEIIHTTVNILGKTYPVRCRESEVAALHKAASYLHDEMLRVQSSGKVINLERIAIITALNLAYQLLEQDQQRSQLISNINQKINQLEDKMDTATVASRQLEMVYSEE